MPTKLAESLQWLCAIPSNYRAATIWSLHWRHPAGLTTGTTSCGQDRQSPFPTAIRNPSSRDGAAMSEYSANERVELHVDVKAVARFLGVSPSLVYSYVERKQ